VIRRLAFLLVMLSAQPALAQDLPALYRVTGVAAGDVLNIRAEPSAAAQIIGSFAPGEAGIEVTAQNETGRWGRVSTGEASGWTSLRYLERQDQGDWLLLEEPLTCFGTEPFWSLRLSGPRAGWSEAGGDPLDLAVQQPAKARGRPDKSGFTAVTSEKPKTSVTGFLSARECSDGMSDTLYGISLDLMMQQDGQISAYSGCCSLQ
jgi:uncharacterized membrane protein